MRTLDALVELGFAACTLETLANAVLLNEETRKVAEALLFVASGIRHSVDVLRDDVVAINERNCRPRAPVLAFNRPEEGEHV